MKTLVSLVQSILFFLIVGLTSCGMSDGEAGANSTLPTELESPLITVRVAGAPVGAVRLIGTFTDQQYIADTTQVAANGEIVLQRDEPYQPGFYYLVFTNNQYIQMLIDADQTFTMTTRMNDLVGAMEVDGSVDNELLYRNLKFETDYQARFNPVREQLKGLPETAANYPGLIAQRDALLAERKAHLEELFKEAPNSFFTAFKTAGQNPDLRDVRLPDGSLDQAGQVYVYRQEFWDNVDFSDDRLINTPVVANKLKRYIQELTSQHPDSIIASTDALVARVPAKSEYFKYFVNWVALQYEPTKTTLMDAEAVYATMIKNYFTYDRAFWSDSAEVYALQLRAAEMGNSLIGQKGPNVTAPDPSGQMRTLYDLTAPYLIVYMYNPDCEHCQEQTPKLVQYYNQMKASGLIDVYAIAVDTEDAPWRNYITSARMPWANNVFDPSNRAIYKTYYVNVTPEIYLLNPERVIIGKNLKVSQIQEVIDRDRNSR